MKIFCGIILRQRHTDQKQMGLLKEQCAEWKKGTSAVLLQSGPDNEWWADSHGMLLQSAKHSRSLVRWEDTTWKAVRNAIEWTSYPVWSNGRISPYFCQRPVATASVRSKSLARWIPWICVVRGRIWKGDVMVADIEELEADGRIWTPRPKAQCKGSVNANERWKIHLPSRR